MLPLSVTRLRRFGPGRDARYCLARIVSSDGTAVEADLDIVDAQGQVVVQVAGLRMGSRSSKSSDRERILSERLLTVEWDETAPRKRPTAPMPVHGCSSPPTTAMSSRHGSRRR